MTVITTPPYRAEGSALPDDMSVGVAPAPRGSDGFCVLLDLEGTTFYLHPNDAAAVGAALVKAAEEAARRSA